jgi:hypothetical protein
MPQQVAASVRDFPSSTNANASIRRAAYAAFCPRLCSLNAILGYNELLLDDVYGDTPEKMRGVLQRIESNVIQDGSISTSRAAGSPRACAFKARRNTSHSPLSAMRAHSAIRRSLSKRAETNPHRVRRASEFSFACASCA